MDHTLHRFVYNKISKVMGEPGKTVYITMIRDPVDIFVSAWEYYKLGSKYYNNMTLGTMQYITLQYSTVQYSKLQFSSMSDHV